MLGRSFLAPLDHYEARRTESVKGNLRLFISTLDWLRAACYKSALCAPSTNGSRARMIFCALVYLYAYFTKRREETFQRGDDQRGGGSPILSAPNVKPRGKASSRLHAYFSADTTQLKRVGGGLRESLFYLKNFSLADYNVFARARTMPPGRSRTAIMFGKDNGRAAARGQP